MALQSSLNWLDLKVSFMYRLRGTAHIYNFQRIPQRDKGWDTLLLTLSLCIIFTYLLLSMNMQRIG